MFPLIKTKTRRWRLLFVCVFALCTVAINTGSNIGVGAWMIVVSSGLRTLDFIYQMLLPKASYKKVHIEVMKTNYRTDWISYNSQIISCTAMCFVPSTDIQCTHVSNDSRSGHSRLSLKKQRQHGGCPAELWVRHTVQRWGAPSRKAEQEEGTQGSPNCTDCR